MKAARIPQEDMAIVEDILFSPVFIYLDLFFLSLIFSYMLYPLHNSFAFATLMFIGFGFLWSGIFKSLSSGRKECLKE